jgi:rhodanese-related sulfurtransferase
MSPEALRGQLATSGPPLVWDFRPTSTFAEGHIPGSRVLTLDGIPAAAANLDRGQAIVTVCA